MRGEMRPSPVSDAIRHRIRETRRRNGLTVAALAEKCGVADDVITNIEHGRKRHITVDELASIATALGVRPGDLWPPAENAPRIQIEMTGADEDMLVRYLRNAIRRKED